VIYQISPFNFPFHIGFSSTAKNIAMGNTIMCRPDKGSIHAQGYFAPLLAEAGVTAQEFGLVIWCYSLSCYTLDLIEVFVKARPSRGASLASPVV
jgi:acyl-CoA reductase-like NAD-dependent aldehyde dehydrogenase